MAKVNYLLACWTGRRRADDPRAAADRTFLVRKHLEALGEAKHSLSQITIILAEGGDRKADDYIKSIRSAGSTPVEVLVRGNEAFSYGSWSHAFEVYKRDFDYYILVEDDYAPWCDHFDRILVGHSGAEGAYVCSLTSMGKCAAISNGIVSSSLWSRVHPAPIALRGGACQIRWTSAFSRHGVQVKDYTEEMSSPFWDVGGVKWFGEKRLPPLFVPIHMVEREVPIQEALVGIVAPRGSPGVDGWCTADRFGHSMVVMSDGEEIEHLRVGHEEEKGF